LPVPPAPVSVTKADVVLAEQRGDGGGLQVPADERRRRRRELDARRLARFGRCE
jgi:hypothetical protein